MTKIAANRDKFLTDIMYELRLHFTRCKSCRGARTARDFDGLCDAVKLQLVEAAVKWDNNIAVRLHHRKSMRGYLYPCPDTSLHGSTYSLVADAYIPGGDQGKLF